MKQHLITGGSGLIGSHVAEELRKRQQAVRVLVMPTSEVSFLKSIGVDLTVGNLHDVSSINKALEGVHVVYHCAASVGDWGSWRKFEEGTVATTANLVQACLANGRPKLVHVSSVSVYGRTSGSDEITEEHPLGAKHWIWDHYGRSKVQAERLVREYPEHVILRPSWTYGPRDRASLPRLMDSLRKRRFRVLGPGDNPLNMIHAADVARGILAAGELPMANGQAYNLCSRGDITQRELIDLLCRTLGIPRVRKHIPIRTARRLAFLVELVFRLFGASKPPPVTQRAVHLLSRKVHFSIAKSSRELNWQPEIALEDGLTGAVAWRLAQEREGGR